MKRLSISIVLILVSVVSISWSGQARRASLPGTSEFLLDEGDILAQPTLAVYYYRNLFADLGGDTAIIAAKSSLLATFADPEQSWGVVALAINYSSPALWSLTMYLDPFADSSFTNNLVERLQNRGVAQNLPEIPLPGPEVSLIYTRRINETWNWGVRLERASVHSAYSYSDLSTDAFSSATGLTVSAGYAPHDNIRADLSLSLIRCSFQSNYSLATLDSSEHLTSNGLGSFSGKGRMFINLNDDMVLVPVINFNYWHLGYDYDKNYALLTAGGDTKISSIRLGCGWQYRPDNKTTFVAGVSTGVEDTTTNDSLVYDLRECRKSVWITSLSLGLEYSLNSWLTARLGGSQELLASSLEQTLLDAEGSVIKTDNYHEPYHLAMGLGFRLRGFVMDLEINPKLLFSGGQLVSGSKHWPVARASLGIRY